MDEQWKLVPTQPTDQMTFIGQSHRYDSVWSIGAIYREMIAAAPTQGADARPVAIYQTRWEHPGNVWGDVPKEIFDNFTDHRYFARRIVYATRDAEASDGQIIGWWDSAEASGFRWKEGIVRGDFSDGTPIYAASAPRRRHD